MRNDPRHILVNAAIRAIVRREGPLNSAEDVRRIVDARALRPHSYAPPAPRRMRGVEATVDHDLGLPVYRVRPTDKTPSSSVVYLHGGAYVGEIQELGWSLACNIAREAGVDVEIPIYPLAPRQHARDTVRMAAEVIARAIQLNGPQNVFVMGDSAGGGLALAAAIDLRDRLGVQPSRLFLFAPWLDITMTNPAQVELQSRDLMLRRDYLREAGRLYAGELSPRDWRCSPIFDELNDLAPLSVFTGDHDILVTDSRSLAQKAEAAGTDVTYIEAPGMQHAYPVFPVIPEARDVRREVVRLIRLGASSQTTESSRT